jgi:hypothetical protein
LYVLVLMALMQKRSYYIFFFLLLIVQLSGQRGLEIGPWIGGSQYYGDLQTDLSLSDPGLAGGLNVRYNFDERICLKGSLNYARVSANDNDSPNSFERQRNLSFFSNIYDASLQAEFNFLPYVHGSKDEWFTPYLFAGVSMFAFSPKTELNDITYNLRDFGTEGQAIGNEYSRFSRAVNFGIGFKWDVNFDWSINIEARMHHSQTDYLDDVSNVFPDLDALAASRGVTAVSLSDRSIVSGIGERGRQRGNNQNKDSFVVFGVSFMKYFGSVACPKVSGRRKKVRKHHSTLDW